MHKHVNCIAGTGYFSLQLVLCSVWLLYLACASWYLPHPPALGLLVYTLPVRGSALFVRLCHITFGGKLAVLMPCLLLSRCTSAPVFSLHCITVSALVPCIVHCSNICAQLHWRCAFPEQQFT